MWTGKKTLLLIMLALLIGSGIFLASIFLSIDHLPNEDNSDPNSAPFFIELPDKILSEDFQLLDTINVSFSSFKLQQKS